MCHFWIVKLFNYFLCQFWTVKLLITLCASFGPSRFLITSRSKKVHQCSTNFSSFYELLEFDGIYIFMLIFRFWLVIQVPLSDFQSLTNIPHEKVHFFIYFVVLCWFLKYVSLNQGFVPWNQHRVQFWTDFTFYIIKNNPTKENNTKNVFLRFIWDYQAKNNIILFFRLLQGF